MELGPVISHARLLGSLKINIKILLTWLQHTPRLFRRFFRTFDGFLESIWTELMFFALPPPSTPPPPFRWGKRPNDFNFLYFDFFFPRHFWVSVGDRSVNLPNTWPTDPASLELSGCHLYYLLISHVTRVANQGCASNPHSFFADSDPAVLLNADPDPDPA